MWLMTMCREMDLGEPPIVFNLISKTIHDATYKLCESYYELVRMGLRLEPRGLAPLH